MSRRTLVVLLAFLAFVSLGLPDGLLGVSWPSMRREFGLPLEALGFLVAIVTAGYLTSSFLSGWILSHLDLGTVLTVSTAAASVALLTFATGPAWPVLLVSGFVAGLAGGAIDAGLNAYGAQHFSTRTINWLHAFFGLGTTLGPLIVTAVLRHDLVWCWSYGIVGTLQAGLAITFFLTRAQWRSVDEVDDIAQPSASAGTLETLRRPIVWRGMLVFFLYSGVEMGTAQWSYSLLTLGRGVPEMTAGLFVTGYWGSIMVGRVLFGLVADRVTLVPALRLCLAVSTFGALLFWLDPTEWLSLAGLMLMGLGLAPVFASLISLTPARVGRAHADGAIGFQIAAAGLGAATLTASIGLAANIMGLEAIGAAVFVLTLLLLALFEAFVRW